MGASRSLHSPRRAGRPRSHPGIHHSETNKSRSVSFVYSVVKRPVGCRYRNAHERTRTSTPFPALVPQTSLSTSSSTWATRFPAVLGRGLEPPRGYPHKILNLARLPIPPPEQSGAEGARTPGLLNAIQALSQLSYSPTAAGEFAGRNHEPELSKSVRAGRTGFEPATSGVTDRHSNRLSYRPHVLHPPSGGFSERATGLEPATFCMASRRSTN